jgi:hypothetical protein
MYMISMDSLPMWLAGIKPGKVREDIRPLLIAYQTEAARALRDHLRDEIDALDETGPAAEARVRVLDAERDRARAGALAALKGIVDDKHLEEKGRILVGQIMGETPEIAPQAMPLYTQSYLEEIGLTTDQAKACRAYFGKVVKAKFTERHGKAPAKTPQEVNGSVRSVYAYTETDRDLFDAAWADTYAAKYPDAGPGRG